MYVIFDVFKCFFVFFYEWRVWEGVAGVESLAF